RRGEFANEACHSSLNAGYSLSERDAGLSPPRRAPSSLAFSARNVNAPWADEEDFVTARAPLPAGSLEAGAKSDVGGARLAGIQDRVVRRRRRANGMRRDVRAVGEISHLGENLPALVGPARAQPDEHVRPDPIAVREVGPSFADDVERRTDMPAGRAPINQLAAREVRGCRGQRIAAVDRIAVEAELVERDAQRRLEQPAGADGPRRADDGLETGGHRPLDVRHEPRPRRLR